MKTTSVKTVGILTSGGDAPGLNAAIRALCAAGKNKYGMKFIGIRNGYRGLIDNDTFKMDKFDLDSLVKAEIQKLDSFLLMQSKKPLRKISLMLLFVLAETVQILLLRFYQRLALM